MPEKPLHTGQRVRESGIYATGNPKVPEIALSSGDRVPPIAGGAAVVRLIRPTRKPK